MSSSQTHYLSGKKIIVAGAGLGGLAFVVALRKQWDPSLQPPEVVIYERDTREVGIAREGYSMSINGGEKESGLVALQKLGLLQETLDRAVLGLKGDEAFKIWDASWGEVISLKLKPYGDLPTSNIRIERRELRNILLRAAEPHDSINWGTWCASAQRLDNGRVRVQLSDQARADAGQDECDLLIAADGANSKIRNSFRPSDQLEYAGAAQIGGRSVFPDGIPAPFRRDWGFMITGEGVGLFVSPCDDKSVVWGLSRLEDEPREAIRDWTPENCKAHLREALEIGHMIQEPFRTVVEASEPGTLLSLPARDKQPFAHDEASGLRGVGVVFIGDANHAVSPFAGNGANLALLDGWDLARCLCSTPKAAKKKTIEEGALEDAVTAYDAASLPRAKKTIKTSHSRISIGHSSGLMWSAQKAAMRVGNLALWLLGR